jgi:rubrerythrin
MTSDAGAHGAAEDRPGDPACLLRRVCPECGAVADRDPPTVCPYCHTDLPGV